MDRKNTDLTQERRIRLRDFLQTIIERGWQVVAIKEVPVEGTARVAFEEGGRICISPVFVIVATPSEVQVCHVWGTERIALCPDYPCLVRA